MKLVSLSLYNTQAGRPKQANSRVRSEIEDTLTTVQNGTLSMLISTEKLDELARYLTIDTDLLFATIQSDPAENQS